MLMTTFSFNFLYTPPLLAGQFSLIHGEAIIKEWPDPPFVIGVSPVHNIRGLFVENYIYLPRITMRIREQY